MPSQKTYEQLRAGLLPKAREVFTRAYYAMNANGNQEAASEISSIYKDLYKDGYNNNSKIPEGSDRIYHSEQHARIQLLPKKLRDDLDSGRIIILNPETALRLRLQDRHDCLYNLGNQKALVSEYAGKYDEKVPFGDTRISVGELMAVCSGFDKAKLQSTAFGGGANELSSAIYAVIKENEILQKNGLPTLSAKEVLMTAATLAATIPFQGPAYLQNMANNLLGYLQVNPNLLTAIDPNLKAHDKNGITKLVDEVVHMARNVANSDVGQMASKEKNPGKDLRDGDRAVVAETTDIDIYSTKPVVQFNVALRGFNKHSDGGFMNTTATKGNIYHDFNPLTPGSTLKPEYTAKELHSRYLTEVAPAARLEHGRDMLLAVMKMASSDLWGEKTRADITDAMANTFIDKIIVLKEAKSELMDPTKFIADFNSQQKEQFIKTFDATFIKEVNEEMTSAVYATNDAAKLGASKRSVQSDLGTTTQSRWSVLDFTGAHENRRRSLTVEVTV